jgi:hypothetical protein
MQKQNETARKQYSQPTLIDHGDAVKATKGMIGNCWESLGANRGIIVDDVNANR